MSAVAAPSLPWWVVTRVALRSLFIQAGFSPEAMQTLGLLYALEPAWPWLYPDAARREEALRRHLLPFNTHPYAAAAIVGGILFHELRLARGEGTPEAVTHFKQTLMGPLAALGDGFYWLSLRPAAGALSVALVPLLGVWAPAVLLVAYNLVHLSTRLWLFLLGYALGDGVALAVAEVKVPLWSQRLRALAAVSVGVAGAALAMGRERLGEVPGWWAVGCLLVGVLAAVAVTRRVSPLAVVYVAATVATLVGALW